VLSVRQAVHGLRLVYTTGNDDYVTSGGAPLGAADMTTVVFVMTQSTVVTC